MGKTLKVLAGAALAACLLSSGCVKRALLVESNPPGARLWINEHPVGVTPFTTEFITHGRYKFRLEKNGFREVIAREMVRAPLYEWIPLDFLFEILVPLHLDDRHAFRYQLVPELPSEKLQEEKPGDLQALVADLKSPDPRRRRIACVELASRRDPSTDIPAVESAARDPVPAVRGMALGTLRALRGKESLPRLIEALQRDFSPEVRWRAAIELEAAGEKEAVPALIGALKDKNRLVRSGAAEALKGLPDPRSVPPLIRTLHDKDTAARRAAAEALGLIGDRAAVRPLMHALFIHDFQTRRRAAKSLQQLKDPVCSIALVRALNDWDPKIRVTAVQSLGEFGDRKVVPTLIRYLLHARQPAIREDAALALGGLKDPRAIQPLQRRLAREPNERTWAAIADALRSLGGEIPAGVHPPPKKVPRKPVEENAPASSKKKSSKIFGTKAESP